MQQEDFELTNDERDLALPNESSPYDDITTAGQPAREVFDNLSEQYGIQTVINLRTHDEVQEFNEAEIAERQGLRYVNIPITGPDDLTREKVEEFDRAVNDAERGLLVHCGSSDRVGALFALRSNWLQGENPETALEIGRRAGLRDLEEPVQRRME